MNKILKNIYMFYGWISILISILCIILSVIIMQEANLQKESYFTGLSFVTNTTIPIIIGFVYPYERRKDFNLIIKIIIMLILIIIFVLKLFPLLPLIIISMFSGFFIKNYNSFKDETWK